MDRSGKKKRYRENVISNDSWKLNPGRLVNPYRKSYVLSFLFQTIPPRIMFLLCEDILHDRRLKSITYINIETKPPTT